MRIRFSVHTRSNLDELHSFYRRTDFVPKEGARVWLSDSDLEEMGTLSFRERGKYKYWVVLTDKGSTKSVPKDAWYPHDNLENKE
jgi:hypothetical protein